MDKVMKKSKAAIKKERKTNWMTELLDMDIPIPYIIWDITCHYEIMISLLDLIDNQPQTQANKLTLLASTLWNNYVLI